MSLGPGSGPGCYVGEAIERRPVTIDTHVDGNALGGLFMDLFGREMTHERACCGICGNVGPLGGVMVYRGPGDVVRCAVCASVLIVTVADAEMTRVSFEGLRWMEFTTE